MITQPMRSLPLLFLLLLLAAGCRVAPPRDPARSPTPPSAFSPAQTDTTNAGRLPWREFFRDSALVGLLDTALGQNLDLRIAVQRVETYQAQYLARRGALFPSVSAGGTAGLDHFGKYTLTGVGNFDTNFSQNIDGRQQVPLGLVPAMLWLEIVLTARQMRQYCSCCEKAVAPLSFQISATSWWV